MDPAGQTVPAFDTEPFASHRADGRRKRISRWDRPPEPHDWRWVVGHIGRTLITLGLLMFGLVAYQLWGTGIQTARQQDRLENEFDQILEDTGGVADTVGPAATTTGASVVPETTTTLPTNPASSTTAPEVPVETTITPETTAVPTPTTAAPIPQNYGQIDPGDALVQLVIPKIDVDWIVVAGVTVKDLSLGPGHFPNTPVPGELGNAAIAGHRTGHGGPFYDLDDLDPGDEILVTTRLGQAYVYLVTDSLIVDPTDYQVITDSDPSLATLTLVTCDPIGTSSRRLVVHSTLDQSRSSTAGAGQIYYGQDEPIVAEPVIPGDDPQSTSAVVVPNTQGSETLPAGPDTAVPAPDTTSAGSTDTVIGEETSSTVPTTSSAVSPTTTTAESAVGQPPGEFEGEDAFSQGWFDDGAAWPHVIGWSVLLGLVAYGAYRVAKRFRRLYLAFIIGFVPVVVILYFFYENVNRLLPAAI